MSQDDIPERTLLDTDTDSSNNQAEVTSAAMTGDEEELPVLQIGSTTLSRLPEAKRPVPSTVCETCPAALWYSRGAKVQCYCRIMHLVSWETGERDPIRVCDGPAIAAGQQ